MDSIAIAGVAMSMQSARLQQSVSMAILKKQLDTTQESAQGLIDMLAANNQAMELSVNPHLGSRMDIMA